MKTKRIERILIPTDYSPNAKRAASIGVSLAKEIGAEVFLFHSYGLPVIGLAESITIVNDLQKLEQDKIAEAVEDLRTEFGEITISGVLEFGSAVDWIQKIVEDKKIDLVIMGTKGETDNSNAIFGSVASHVVTKVNCPVLIIPRGHKSYNITEVLFATDFHFTNDVATYLSPFLFLMEEFTPFVHVVHFKPEVTEATHVKNIEEMKLTGLLKDTKHSFHYMESENTEEGLFEFAEKRHCDLIVMVTRHYTLWERIFHRSLTKKIAMHTEIPLLVLHEQ